MLPESKPKLPMHEIELKGLDGSNLLAFLAALGTLRVLTLAEPESQVRLSWRDGGWWMPVVHHARIESGDDLVESLAQGVVGERTIHQAWTIGPDLTMKRTEFRQSLLAVVENARSNARSDADFLSAFGSEFVGCGPKKEQMTDTEFRTMSGSGHQHFLNFMSELAGKTNACHLRRALFDRWDYADGGPSLRWDPNDYRPHALRAVAPKDDPIQTMRGANRLAVEGLPFFPTAPARRELRTVGFEDRDGHAEITWPIWVNPLGAASVGSLVACKDVQDAAPAALLARGVAQVYRAFRFTDGKYRNFSPAREML